MILGSSQRGGALGQEWLGAPGVAMMDRRAGAWPWRVMLSATRGMLLTGGDRSGAVQARRAEEAL